MLSDQPLVPLMINYYNGPCHVYLLCFKSFIFAMLSDQRLLFPFASRGDSGVFHFPTDDPKIKACLLQIHSKCEVD